eukprot:238562-Prymnesium_polylepis.4
MHESEQPHNSFDIDISSQERVVRRGARKRYAHVRPGRVRVLCTGDACKGLSATWPVRSRFHLDRHVSVRPTSRLVRRGVAAGDKDR